MKKLKLDYISFYKWWGKQSEDIPTLMKCKVIWWHDNDVSEYENSSITLSHIQHFFSKGLTNHFTVGKYHFLTNDAIKLIDAMKHKKFIIKEIR
jgi:hypothetical protein